MPIWAISAAAPIQTAWAAVVFPALALNYLGQGALMLDNPEAIANPFFLMAPAWALCPWCILATIATVIASQAVITGAFSVTQQAIQLGLLPRMEIQYTSDVHAGQIYLPDINRLLLLRRPAAGVHVRHVGRAGLRLRHRRHRHDGGHDLPGVHRGLEGLAMAAALAALFIAPFLVVDLTFLAANLLKVFDGGYVPLMIAAGIIVAMWTWVRGTADHLSQDPHRPAAGRPDPPARAQPADPSAEYRDLPDQRPRRRADGTPAQPQAQHGPARAQRHHERPHRDHPAGRRRGPGQDRAIVRRLQPGRF